MWGRLLSREDPPSGWPPGADAVAWLAWSAATAGALMFVVLLGRNVPFWDEWKLVPMVTGNEPVTARLLWSLHNEHRIPLPRLLYLGLFAASGGDFRAAMLFNVLALSATAALLIAAARRARGRGSAADAALPLLLLHPGHAENLLWGFQIGLVVLPLLVAVVLAAVISLREGVARGQAWAIGTAMLLAPLCGAPGVAVAPVMGGWLLWRAIRGPGTDGPTPLAGRVLLGALGAAPCIVTLLYFWGYQGNPLHPKPPGASQVLRGVSEFLGVALGPASATWWPLSAGLVLAALVFTAGAIAWWWRSSPDARLPAEGLVALLTALSALALAVGYGRSGIGSGAAQMPRYAALAVPLITWVHLAWCRLPWPRLGRLVQMSLLLASVCLYPGNLGAGAELGLARREALERFVRALHRGMPLAEAAAQHAATVCPDPTLLETGLRMLRPLRLGPFSRAEDEARWRRRFPFIRAPLVSVRGTSVTPHADRVGGRDVLVVPADGDLTFDVRPGQRRAAGQFGRLPDSYFPPEPAGQPPYDGTYVMASFRSDDGEETELFARLINPREKPEDRGLRPFAVALPGEGGQLILSVRAGPPGTASNDHEDWGIWRDVSIR